MFFIMSKEMISACAKLLLLLFLLLFSPIEGGESGELEGSGEIGGTTFSSTTTSAILAQTQQETACGPSNLIATVERSMSISSPNYPQSYPPNIECWWTITAPPDYKVQINFITFELEQGYDFLRLYDAPSQAEATESYGIILHSRFAFSESILSFSNYVTLKFTSDRTVQQKGFRLTFRATAVTLTCPRLPTPSNGSQVCYFSSGNVVNCRVFCNQGFRFSGSERRWCLSNGTWIGKQGSCEQKTCSKLLPTENAAMSCTDGSYFGSKCLFTCNDGYELFGSKYRSCDISGMWSGSDTSCVGVACPILPTPGNGEKVCIVGNNNTFVCQFSCMLGFKLSGSRRRWCQSNNGTWNGSFVTCDKMQCPKLPVPANGTMSCTNLTFGVSLCYFTCNDGYELFGSESRLCSSSGYWSGLETSCQSSPPTPTCNVDRESICDGLYHCSDKSDETGCSCPRYKFKCDCYEVGCPSAWGCIAEGWRCNGKNDCGDWSDERNCHCSDTRFECKDGDCIDRSKVVDGKNDCINGDDEFICDTTQGHVKCGCMRNDEQCVSFDRCILNSWIGDTIPDCENHDDEPCLASKVFCDECWVTINRCSTNQTKNILLQNSRNNATRCYSLAIPSDQRPKVETHWICTTSPCGKCLDVFRCDSGQFIDNENYCDKNSQCHDGSDELINGLGFRCSGKSRNSYCVLPQENVYDSVAQCADNSDLCFVNGEFRCLFCLDGKLIVSEKQFCDGKVDCYDMSDECLCEDQSVCNEVLGEGKTKCPLNKMHCYSDTDCINMDKVLCNSSVDCIGERNMKFCRRSIEVIRCPAWSSAFDFVYVQAARCDGRPECASMEDECDCEPLPSFCNNECGVDARGGFYGNFVCDGNLNQITLNSTCDLELETICPMRFECKSKSKISIDVQSVCDGIKDCDHGEDENRKFCGGKVTFSNLYEMIANPILQMLFWIMGLLALIGNICINIHTAKDVYFSKNSQSVKFANDIFILNLTVSDFLMGIYLIAVIAQGRRYSGFYSICDKEWRASKLCTGLGTLALLSSETSAFIMAAMSTFRLVTIYKPFLSKCVQTKWIYISGCLCWIVSFLLAAIPLFPFDSGYFISDVSFRNSLFKSDIILKSDVINVAKRISFDNSDLKSWSKVKEIISDTFKDSSIQEEFGYYSETSVCMPRFYASTIKGGWEYSTFLISLNFLLFFFMVVAYVLVYKNAKGMKQSRSTKKDPNKGMQKRISRLLLSDFCCWIPVCIMGYLSVAGVHLPPNAYIASAGFLLPINSAMNPILYSKFIGQQVSRTKKWIIQKFSTCSCPADDTIESCGIRAEDVELRVIEVIS